MTAKEAHDRTAKTRQGHTQASRILAALAQIEHAANQGKWQTSFTFKIPQGGIDYLLSQGYEVKEEYVFGAFLATTVSWKKAEE